MLAMLNSRERSAEEWKAMIEGADLGFKVSSIIQPTLANMAIIEVVWSMT